MLKGGLHGNFVNLKHAKNYDSKKSCLLVKAQVTRMLRLSEAESASVAEFHGLHRQAKEEGFGRLFRSPTLFEDMVKSLLLCNCGYRSLLHFLFDLLFFCWKWLSKVNTNDAFKSPFKNSYKSMYGYVRDSVKNGLILWVEYCYQNYVQRIYCQLVQKHYWLHDSEGINWFF